MRFILVALTILVLGSCGATVPAAPTPPPVMTAAPVASPPVPSAPVDPSPDTGPLPPGMLVVTRQEPTTRATDLVQFSLSEGSATTPITLTTCVADDCMIEGVALAPDGSRLAYAQRSRQTNRARLLLHDPITHGEQVLVADADLIEQPRFSPDSQHLAYVVGSQGQGLDVRQDLYVATLDGSAPLRLVTQQRFLGTVRWSPDSQSVFFSQASDGPPPSGYAIFQLARAGGEPTLVLAGAQLVGVNPAGDQLLVRTERGQGQWGLAVYAPATAATHLFDLAGWSVFEADWSPTGMIVATAARSPALPTAIIAFPASATQVAVPHETGLAGILEPRWLGGQPRVLVMNTTAGASQLLALPFAPGATTPGTPEILVDPATNFYVPSYAVRP